MVNKKANFTIEAVTAVVVLIAFVLIIIIGSKFMGEINDKIQDNPQLSTQTKEMVQQSEDIYPSLFDGLVVLAFTLLYIALLASAFFVDVHPVIFYVSIGLMLIFVVIIAILGNAFQDIITSPQLSTELVNFPMSIWIMEHILILGLVMVFSASIVGYAKSRS